MGGGQVKAELPQAGDKGHARRLRMENKIPAIVYGAGEESIPVALNEPAFVQMLRHISSGNQIFELAVAGRSGPSYQVLIKDVQRNPVDGSILHVDLQHISMTHKVRVHVPVHLEGVPAGVKEGGVLEHFLRELDLECLPGDIPEHVVVDVTDLVRGQALHVRDLKLPASVHVHDSSDRVVVTVAGKQKEEVEAAPAAAPAEEPAKESE